MAGPFAIDTSASPHAALRPVPISAVRLEGGLWGARLELLARVSLPAQHRSLEAAGVLDNFRRAAGRSAAPFRGLEVADTDLYKWLEAACWVLAGREDGGLRGLVSEAIDLVAAAQEPDGYLDTFHAGRPGERWSNLRSHHELYCVGHLVQAGIAHRRATGDERLLRVARRAADLVCRTFGPPASGRRAGVDGHPGVELALVELYRETGERAYLEQARHFLEARGHRTIDPGRFGSAYYLDHVPLRELAQIGGHAVRALYGLCGATDLYLETGDPGLRAMLDRVWTRMVRRQLYVSGGLGARRETESFGDDLELPNRTACAETCAAVGGVMWCQRLLAATGEARYADLAEWTLYNALLVGWSLDGEAYTYENPLQDGGGHRRQPWFECACCPPNLARTVAAFPGLLYALGQDSLIVNHYAASVARLEVQGRAVELRQETRYPWDGDVELRVEGEGELELRLRIPGWCAGAAVHVNGAPIAESPAAGTYARIRRTWARGDRLRLTLPMAVRALRAHPRVPEDDGRVALARGPLLYCLEAADHPGAVLEDLELDPAQAFVPEWREAQLGGVVVLRGAAAERTPDPRWEDRLYAPVEAVSPGAVRPVRLEAIPYHAWGNRAPGAMQVWLRARPSPSW
jgi:DUF1680 family protein